MCNMNEQEQHDANYSEELRKLQQKLFTGEIRDSDYEEKYESLRQKWRLEVELILNK